MDAGARCPHCGAVHNPLLNGCVVVVQDADVAAEAMTRQMATTYLYLCAACGETYSVEIVSPQS